VQDMRMALGLRRLGSGELADRGRRL